MTLREVLQEMGAKHKRVKRKHNGYSDLLYFNLREKTIKNGGLVLVDKGIIQPQTITLSDNTKLILEDDWGLTDEEFYSGMEERFHKYNMSCPSSSDRFVKSNFVARAADSLSYEEFMKGGNRSQLRYELEWFMMASAVNKTINWNDSHWYWKSNKYPNLIIYKFYL